MKWTEITLSHVQGLRFGETQIATIEQQGRGSGITSLIFDFGTRHQVKLKEAVDISEQLDFPRVFVIEGSIGDTFVIFGGERAYWLTVNGTITRDYKIFRESGYEEYWTTQILERESELLIIYEAGVLAIDETLHVLWHKPKYYNDAFVGFAGAGLKFVRDHDREWVMSQ